MLVRNICCVRAVWTQRIQLLEIAKQNVAQRHSTQLIMAIHFKNSLLISFNKKQMFLFLKVLIQILIQMHIKMIFKKFSWKDQHKAMKRKFDVLYFYRFIIQSTDKMLAIWHNKQNCTHASNANIPSPLMHKDKAAKEKDANEVLPSAIEPQEKDDVVRKQLLNQQHKNKALRDQILSKNDRFNYELHKKTEVSGHLHMLVRQHEALLHEEAFLLKQLAKMEYDNPFMHHHSDPFTFLVDVWEKDGPEQQNLEDRIDRLNQSVSFLKINVKQVTKKFSNDHMAFSKNIILQSPQYRQLSLKCTNYAQQIQRAHQYSNQQANYYQLMIDNLTIQNQNISKQNKQLRQNLHFYEDKSKELLSKIAVLTQDINQQQRKTYEATHGFAKRYQSMERQSQNKPIFQINIKINTPSSQPKTSILRNAQPIASERSIQQVIDFIENKNKVSPEQGFSLTHSSVISEISFESISNPAEEDKQNSLFDVLNDLNAQQDRLLPYASTKKLKNIKKKELLFSNCKQRANLFNNNTSKVCQQSDLMQKTSLRFIRRK